MRNTLEQIQTDAVLGPDLRPEWTGAAGTSNTALITGATGFLGRYIVARLLQASDQNLILLARATSDQTVQDRVRAILAEIGIDLARFPGRVQILQGDIAQDAFGLDPVIYQTCANAVTTIYHCSAMVDWVRDYGRLCAVNVEGVRHMIRFACLGRKKRIVFPSSIAVCMFTDPHGEMSEDAPVFPHIAKMPLGYARSKAVAETLLYQSAQRGVPVTIIRPPLISGESQTGHCNPSDIFAALLQACIVTGQGPDTDWTFDITPVDYVAQVLTDVPQGSRNWQVLNLKQKNARSWENLLTWINLHGYRVERIPTDVWIQNLFGDAAARGLMLYTQRQYFMGRPPRAGETDWVRPFEAYLANSYATVNGDHTMDLLDRLGIKAPDIDIDMLHAYFGDFRRAGVLPNREHTPETEDRSGPGTPLAEFLARHNACRIGKQSGIMNQLAASHAQQSAGVWVLNGTARDGCGQDDRKVIKVMPDEGVLRDQSAVLATAVSPRLGALFRQYDDPFELKHCCARERALYRNPPDGLDRFIPRVFQAGHPGAVDHAGLLMEYLPGADRAADASWLRTTDPDFAHVIEGMASVHAVVFGQKTLIDAAIKPVQTPGTPRMLHMLPLWAELATVAAPTFARYGGHDITVLHRGLLQSLADWWPHYEALPRTLIHNDFNPRNFVLRHAGDSPRLCLYDWEIAAIGPPQRDLAELLCFTWTAGSDLTHLKDILTRSHDALRAKTGHTIPRDLWYDGVRLAVQYFMVSRLPLYALINHLSPLPFLPGLIANSAQVLGLAQSLQSRTEA